MFNYVWNRTVGLDLFNSPFGQEENICAEFDGMGMELTWNGIDL